MPCMYVTYQYRVLFIDIQAKLLSSQCPFFIHTEWMYKLARYLLFLAYVLSSLPLLSFIHDLYRKRSYFQVNCTALYSVLYSARFMGRAQSIGIYV